MLGPPPNITALGSAGERPEPAALPPRNGNVGVGKAGSEQVGVAGALGAAHPAVSSLGMTWTEASTKSLKTWRVLAVA